jgi:hypothetical protein
MRDRAADRTEREGLLDRVMQLAARPPVVVQPVDTVPIVNATVEGMTKLMYGYQQAFPQPVDTQADEMSMDRQGLDNRGGVKEGEFMPDIEVDPFMDGPYPTRGGWVGGNLPPQEGQTPVHTVIDGRLVRRDGRPLMGSGQGNTQAPHEGGIIE